MSEAAAPRDEEKAVPGTPPAGLFRSETTTRANSPTPGAPTYKPNMGSRLKAYLKSNVDTRWADVILIICFFVSGLVDSVAFSVWNCFASMQTGNTIFIALGASNQPFNAAPYSWAKSLTALICFIIGALSFATFHRTFGATRRWVLILSFGIQATMIGVAAILATVGYVSNNVQRHRTYHPETHASTVEVEDVSWNDLAPLALLAFQSSGQIVASRMLKYNELPTVVITSLFCDLMSDPQLFTAAIKDDVKRNRRFISAILLFCGAVSGGFATIGWIGLTGALWIAAILKAFMALAWVFWRPAATKASA